MNSVFDKDLRNTCPECGAWLTHEGGCTICKQCGFGVCGRWIETVAAFGLVIVLAGMMVLA